MEPTIIADDALALWDLPTDLTNYHKVELFFRRPLHLKSNPTTPVHSAIGLITKPTQAIRPVRMEVSRTIHKSVAGTWNFREKHAGWQNPTGEIDIIEHADIDRMVFHRNDGTVAHTIINKYTDQQ